ncbi:uncharacterized protein LOC143049402 [Mytilus galloprovincialis]|uniref:uncharacterized protein LOC143049402 n=1 Tax=Mytilus galloprovincialis TaxID=29158 RepID=UPI003F7B9744
MQSLRKIIGWIFPSAIVLSTVNGCDFVGLNLCTWKLSQNVSESKEFTVLPHKRQIESLCSYREEFKNCYTPKLSKCSDDLMYASTFATTLKTVNFICTSGFSDMVLHDDCWRKPDVQNRSNACYKDHVQNVKSQLEQISMLEDAYTDQVKQEWCKILLGSYQCMQKSVSDSCGQSSVDVVTDMMNTVFEQMNSIMTCQEHDRSTSQKEFISFWESLIENGAMNTFQDWSMVTVIISLFVILYQ